MYTQTQQIILRNVRRYLSGRDANFADTLAEAAILRALPDTQGAAFANIVAGRAAAIAQLLANASTPTAADEAFYVTGTVTKSSRATGSVVFTGLPSDGQTVTISDGAHTAKVFEMDDGTAAVGTLTFTGVPADTGTVTLGDGTTSVVFEFDTGVLGVASTGGLITFTGVPADTNTITLTTSTTAGATATIYEFNNTGGVTAGRKAVLTGVDVATAGAEFAAAVNATGGYAGNGSTGYTATDNLDGTVTLIRTAAGAGSETITKSGANITVTTSFSGGVTQVAVGSAVTGGRVGVGTAATPGGVALSTAAVCTNLIAAIAAVTGPTFLFTATQGAGTTVTLTANTKGTAGNSFTMVESATNFTVSAGTFASGAAAGSGAVTGSNIAVAIGATAALCATALHTAVNAASSLDITSANGTAGTVSLTNDAGGTAGNVAIIETLSNATATGMSGGLNVASVELLSDEEVGDRTVFVTFFTADTDTTSWNEATSVVLENNDGTDFATLAKAALVGDALVIPTSANVTVSDAMKLGTGGTAGSGLKLTAVGTNEDTGGDVTVVVSGVLKNI